MGTGTHWSDFYVAWLEEPLYPFDVHGHAELAASITTPLLHGENLYEPLMIRDMLEAGALGIVQPSDMKLGGLTRWMEVAELARVEDATRLRVVLKRKLLSAENICAQLERAADRAQPVLLQVVGSPQPHLAPADCLAREIDARLGLPADGGSGVP